MSRARAAERGALLVLVGTVLIVNVVLRLATDVGPLARIGLSLLAGLVVAGVTVGALRQRR